MLKDRLKADIITAMKAHDSERKTTLGMLQSAIKNRELEKRSKLAKSGTPEAELESASQLTDEEAVDVVFSEVKKRKDSIEQFTAGGRADLADKEKGEISVLQVYMPEQMSEDEAKKLISDAIASTGASGPKDMGRVMGAISSRIKGKFDGGRASALVKEALGS